MQYRLAGAIGVVLWLAPVLANRAIGVKAEEPDLETAGTRGPVS